MRVPTKRSALQTLRRFGLSVGTVLDVGVLTGTPELAEAWPDRQHILFEPIAEFHASIALAYAAVPHVLVPAAVSAADGSLELAVMKMDGRSDITHSVAAADYPGVAAAEMRTVRALRLDTYCRDAGLATPYLLKIDVDGHERAILEGARGMLHHVSCVVLEVTPGTFFERSQLLLAAGFHLWDATDFCYFADGLHQFDAIWISDRERKANPHLDPWKHRTFSYDLWQAHTPAG
jgi:FkbM family methyltransferase